MTPEQMLIEKAAVPEFFAKIAAETGTTPHSPEAARQLLTAGDRVVLGVERYIAKVAAARTATQDRIIKAAAAAADVFGVDPKPAATVAASDPTKIAADAEAYEAALEILKKANIDVGSMCPVAAPKAEKEDEEETEDDKKTKTPPVAV